MSDMRRITSAEVQAVLVPLERDLESFGWDAGVSAWLMHADNEQPLELIKIIDRARDFPPLEMVETMPPFPAPCHHGMAVAFECWATEDHARSVRFVAGALRDGRVVLVTRLQDAKPQCTLVPPDTMPNVHEVVTEILLALRQKLTTMPVTGLPPFLQQLLGGGQFVQIDLNQLFRGEQPDAETDQ